MTHWIDQCGGRKFMLSSGVLIACTALLWVGRLDSGAFTAIILGTVGLYIGGNVTQKRQQGEKS
jgi:uncharacterized membrane protein YeaQ/YmgE (transglycosylase-associated protein family)